MSPGKTGFFNINIELYQLNQLNIKLVLGHYNIEGYCGRSDSTMVLHWINGKERQKQYVQNRVNAIISRSDFIKWHYIPTDQYPSDIGSRGKYVHNLQLMWSHGPKWVKDEALWPE